MGVKIDVEPGSAAENLVNLTEGQPLETAGPAMTDAVLAHSFRTLLLNMNITPEKWNELMDKFLDSQGLTDRTDRTSARGNLTKELANNRMTWKVYCKGLRMLGLTDIRFAIFGSGEGVPLVDSSVSFHLK